MLKLKLIHVNKEGPISTAELICNDTGSQDYQNNTSLTLSQCTLAGPVYTGVPLVDTVYIGLPLANPANAFRVHWNATGKKT